MTTQLQKLMFSISLMDKVTGPAGRIQKTISNVAGTAKDSFAQMAAGTAGIAAAGYTLNALATPARAFNKAVGEVRSLDVAQSSLDMLSDKAIQFSIKYGESATDFVRSSYDIQSAIGGLTGKELSSFTNASNILAKGTKADGKTITDYMGTMYTVFKDSANDMGKAKWVEQLTGQTAMAVQLFKTDGKKMAETFSAIGADATSSGISQAEQIAVLGTLGGSMSGSTAGTMYSAFLGGVDKAQKKLGLNFTDSNGQMLGMLDILEKIRGKFGDLDISEKTSLTAAFGTDQATKLISLLIKDTDGLSNSISKIGQVSGMDKAMTMAQSMVDPFDQFSQGVQAVRIGLGQALLPVLNPVVSAMAEGAGVIYGWTKEYPVLTSCIGYAVVGITGLTGAVVGLRLVLGFSSMATMVFNRQTGIASVMTKLFGKEAIISKIALGAWGLVVKAIGIGLKGLRGGLMLAGKGFLWLGKAMFANPIGMVITGVSLLIAGVGALIYYWDDLTAAFLDSTWGQTILSWVDKITGAFNAMGSWFGGLADSWQQAVMGWVDALAGGIKSLGAWLWDFGATLIGIGGKIVLFSNPIGWLILGVKSLMSNWDNLKASFLDSTWGQTILGWVDRITGAFNAMGSWLGGLADSWQQAVMGWVDALAGGIKSLGVWLWDFGATLIGIGGKIVLFSNPIGWLILGVKSLMSNWDNLKASFLDSTWGQTILGWIETVIGGFQKLTGAFSWVKDKLSWMPGFGNEKSVVNTAVPGMDTENGYAANPIVPGIDAENKYTGHQVTATVPGMDTENRYAVNPIVPGIDAENKYTGHQVTATVPGMDTENRYAVNPIVPGIDAENKYTGHRVTATVPGLDTENKFAAPMDKANIPETSPSLSAPRRSEVIPGGAGRSIANAITQNTDRSSAKTVHIGKIISNRPANHIVENMLAMGA